MTAETRLQGGTLTTDQEAGATQEIDSIREAHQPLSRYLERIEQGPEIIITRRGKLIARVLPIIEDKPRLSDARRAACERLRERMNRGYVLGGIRSERDNLHERGQ